MNAPERRLIRHLSIAIALKLVALVLLWFLFFRPGSTVVDSGSAARHIAFSPESSVQREAPHDQ